MDGSRVVSGSFDKTVKVWNVETGEPLHTLHGHSPHVNSVAMYGSLVVIVDDSRETVAFWSIADASPRLLGTHSTRALYKSELRVLIFDVAMDASRLVIGFFNKIIVWENREGALYRPPWFYKGNKTPVFRGKEV